MSWEWITQGNFFSVDNRYIILRLFNYGVFSTVYSHALCEI